MRQGVFVLMFDGGGQSRMRIRHPLMRAYANSFGIVRGNRRRATELFLLRRKRWVETSRYRRSLRVTSSLNQANRSRACTSGGCTG
jgi:hypothetical protein